MSLKIESITSQVAKPTASDEKNVKKSDQQKKTEKVGRLSFIHAQNRPKKAAPLCERVWEWFKALPIIGHALRAIIWVVATIAAWIFGDPVESYKKALNTKNMTRLLTGIETRHDQLSKSLTNWKMKGMSDIVKLTAIHIDIESLQDTLLAFREQFSPNPVRKGEVFDLPRAKRLEGNYQQLRTDLKRKVEQNLKAIQLQLEEVQNQIATQQIELNKLANSDKDSHTLRNARLILLYACDNYIRGMEGLQSLGLIAADEDVSFQKVVSISSEIRKEMKFHRSLPEVWAKQIERDSSESLELAPDDIGIENIGNSCYMNSGLQMLFGMGAFFRGLVATDLEQEKGEKDIDFKRRYRTQKSLRKVVDAFLSKDARAIRRAMVDFRARLFRSRFFENGEGITQQQDGPGFVGILLSALGFGFHWRTMRTVMHEGKNKLIIGEVKREAILDVTIENCEGMNFEKVLLNEFCSREMKDTYRTQINGKPVTVSKFAVQSQITKSIPDFLPIHLLRMNMDGSKKNYRIPFPEGGVIDLTPIFDPKICKGEAIKYKVVSFLMHHGPFGDGGHYTAYCLCPDGKWRHYDDSHVTEVTAEEAEQEMSHAYGLLLSRV